MTQPARPTTWWQAMDRRTFGKGVVAFTTLMSLSGCDSEKEISTESFKLQQQHGWNIGAKESRLFFTSAKNQDAKGSTEWQPYSDPTRLLEAWKPHSDTWQTFFTPTLIQALKADSLRTQMRPAFNPAMREAFLRGETLQKELLSQVTKGAETFFIADLPGPEAVAFGAGLAGWADLLPGFENWPHPYGVVRSHETLAAMLYYASYIQERKKQLPESPPALLLLDSNRLAAYTDADTQFDNRYLATVPSPAALRQRGINNIMYIVPTREQTEESDDLNDDFVAYKDAHLKVVIFPLNDIKQVVETVEKTAPDGTTQRINESRYYYGGGMNSHLAFLLLYSFLSPRQTVYYPPPGGYASQYPPGPSSPGGGGGGWRGTTLDSVRPPPTPAPSYQPRPRATIFSSTRIGGGESGVGKVRPSGFGRTTVRESGGRITGIQTGSGRSGSLGRGAFSSSSA